jgi:hypothetical protein
MRPGMVIRGVVQEQYNTATSLAAFATDQFQKGVEGSAIKHLVFSLIYKLTIAKPNSTEITDTFSCRVVKQHRFFLPQEEPTYGNVTHTVENGLHHMTKHRSFHPLGFAGFFFECALYLWIGTSDHWPRLSQSEIKLPKESLALTHAELYAELSMNKGG